MIVKMHGTMLSLALAFLTAAASLAAQAQAPAPGQPLAQPQNQPAAAPQTQPAQPATAAPVEQKKVSTSLGQDFSIVKPMFPNPIAPYTAGTIPAPVFVNSPRVQQRIQNGKLLVSMQDAIELALENNTDILVQRYFPSLAQLDILRTLAGANGRGVGNVNVPAIFGNNPAVGSFDPAITSSLTFDSRHAPVNNPLTAGTGTTSTTLSSQFTHNTNTNVAYVQAFPSGTQITAALNTNRASTTSSAQFFSPSVQTVGSFTLNQQLLNGW